MESPLWWWGWARVAQKRNPLPGSPLLTSPSSSSYVPAPLHKVGAHASLHPGLRRPVLPDPAVRQCRCNASRSPATGACRPDRAPGRLGYPGMPRRTRPTFPACPAWLTGRPIFVARSPTSAAPSQSPSRPPVTAPGSYWIVVPGTTLTPAILSCRRPFECRPTG
jgi:hypothetical protein